MADILSIGASATQLYKSALSTVGNNIANLNTEGYTRQVADASILVPVVNKEYITPHSESFQTVLWHLFASLPQLKINATKWESVVKI